MKKKALALFLALAILAGMLVIPASAVGGAAVSATASDETVYRGGTVTVDISLDENPGMAYWSLDPDYDDDVFELTGFVKADDCTLNPTIVKRAVFGGYAYNEEYEGGILKLTFKVKEDAAYGKYDLGVFLTEAYTLDFDDVSFNITNAKVTVAPIAVTSVTLDKTEISILMGNTETLTATVLPDNAGDKTVTWTTSNEAVATVENGVVTGTGAGTATITAKAGDKTATCAVTVTSANVPVTGITLNSVYSGMIVEDKVELIATVTPDYATDKTVTWTSSNEAVATVDANGVVTAVGAGSVKITATAGEASASVSFTVLAKLHDATIDGEDSKVVLKKYDSSNRWYQITVPAGTKTVGITGVGDLRFVNHGNKNPQNGDCPTGMYYEDGVLYMDLDTYTRNDSYMAFHYGLDYSKYSQRSLEFWGSNNWSMHCFFVVIEPCTGEHSWIEANCTEPKHCSVCGTIEGEALGHDWEVTTPEVPAVCETPGTTAIETCQREGCGTAENPTTQGGATIPAPGHDWHKVMDTKQPTCTEEGETLYTCYTCPEGNAATKYEPIAALGHTWEEEGEVTTEPTCTEKGVKTFECTVCEDGEKTEEIPANGHTYVDGYCSVEGCGKMAPVEIPFKKADGSDVHSKYTGKVESLIVDGVRISHWDGFTQASSLYTEQKITIYVDPADKDESVTLSLKLADGQSGSGKLIGQTQTIQLTNGVGSYTADRMTIGTGWRDPQLHLYITFALGYCTGEHQWQDATCIKPKTCYVCGKTEGEALGHDWDENSKCKRTGCDVSNTITKIEISHPNLDENTGAMTMVTGVSEQIDLSAALVDANVPSTQVVQWTSSNESVATVDQNGKVTAVSAGIAIITAKAVDASGIALAAAGEDILAQITLNVAAPESGYTVTMPGDKDKVVGNTVEIPVTVGHTDSSVTKYNAFDMTFEYDASVLELTSTEIEGMTVKAENGKIHIERYGLELDVGTAFTLTFKTLKAEDTYVKVTSAKVDISEAALTQDAPDASVIDNVTLVNVTGYTVNLPADFEGEASVLPGEDYTFEAKDKNYDYTVTATINGTEINVEKTADGEFKIAAADITGNIDITSEKTGKTFAFDLSDDFTTEAVNAQYMKDFIATLQKKDDCSYDIKVTIGGEDFTGYQYDAATGVITIPGESVTGKVTIDSGKEELPPQTYKVEFTGDGAGEAVGEKTVEEGATYTFTLNNIAGVSYKVSYVMGDAEAVELAPVGGTYTIENVTGNLVITVEKISDLEVEVTEYVKLNNKSVFLVTATQTLADDEALSYNGTPMFWSEQYNAWAYLVITEGTLSDKDAKTLITHGVADKESLSQTYNVNGTSKVDINDAQLVFDMYNNVYQDFSTATMDKFLNADVNGDKAINVSDAAAIVAQIVAAKNP